MRELVENGFEVAVVGDATASAKLPGLDGDQAAQTNYKMISSKVYTTQELVGELKMHKK
jgi:nicotinamidase-related amidase